MGQALLRVRGVIDLDEWRTVVRPLLVGGIPPDAVQWFDPEEPQASLADVSMHVPNMASALEANRAPTGEGGEREDVPPLLVPRKLLALAKLALCFKNASKWEILYRVAWRIARGGERSLLSNAVDDDVHALTRMAKAVKRDAHKMKAFVRFRRVVEADGSEHFVAFHRPEHRIVGLVGPFFARRFAVIRWTILTPVGSATWDGVELRFGPSATRSEAPSADTIEDVWKTYYANIFNPARVNPRAMAREMPRKFWSTLPEAVLIDDLLKNAGSRTDVMAKRTVGEPGAVHFIPPVKDGTPSVALKQLEAAAEGCRGCELYKRATQVVFGEGPAKARMVLVGEQPGDQEDVKGEPFVGPAGKLLDRALVDAGIERSDCYLTNAVKHFSWTPDPRGKRRIHQKPTAGQVRACKPWLEHELGLIKPAVVVLLGATAAQSLLGASFRVTQSRGKVLGETPIAPAVVATIHPSMVLRTPDEDREAAYRGLVADLKVAAKALKG